jgi:predicted Zn-dependent protease
LSQTRNLSFVVALASLSIVMSALLSGCGAGGGTASVSTPSISNTSSDTKSNPPVENSGVVSGCTVSTYSPNYANLMPLYRWASFPLKVRFLNSRVVTLTDGTQADLAQAAMDGFSEWAAATNNGITFQVTTDPAQTNVTVHFGDLPAAPTANDVLGLEQSTLYSDNTIKSADILLNTWPAMSAPNVTSFRETAAHEFGHAIGINGHSDSPQDVMFAAHSLVTGKTLSERDINTLRTGYCNQFGRSASPSASGSTRIVTNN